MKMFVIAATLFSLIGFLLSSGAFAQTETTPGRSSEPSVTRPSETTPMTPPGGPAGREPKAPMGAAKDAKELYASSLIGTNVQTPQGESIGKIKELVIAPKDARIETAVISMGGMLGIGSRSVAVPWDKVKPQDDGRGLVVAMGKEELENAPEWKKPEEARPIPTQPPATAPGGPQPGPPGPGATGR